MTTVEQSPPAPAGSGASALPRDLNPRGRADALGPPAEHPSALSANP